MSASAHPNVCVRLAPEIELCTARVAVVADVAVDVAGVDVVSHLFVDVNDNHPRCSAKRAVRRVERRLARLERRLERFFGLLVDDGAPIDLRFELRESRRVRALVYLQVGDVTVPLGALRVTASRRRLLRQWQSMKKKARAARRVAAAVDGVLHPTHTATLVRAGKRRWQLAASGGRLLDDREMSISWRLNDEITWMSTDPAQRFAPYVVCYAEGKPRVLVDAARRLATLEQQCDALGLPSRETAGGLLVGVAHDGCVLMARLLGRACDVWVQTVWTETTHGLHSPDEIAARYEQLVPFYRRTGRPSALAREQRHLVNRAVVRAGGEPHPDKDNDDPLRYTLTVDGYDVRIAFVPDGCVPMHSHLHTLRFAPMPIDPSDREAWAEAIDRAMIEIVERAKATSALRARQNVDSSYDGSYLPHIDEVARQAELLDCLGELLDRRNWRAS